MGNENKAKPAVSVEFYSEQNARMACVLVRETMKVLVDKGFCGGCENDFSVRKIETATRQDLLGETFFADVYL